MSWLDQFFAESGVAPIVVANGAISITPATESAAGSMSAADKTKLDGIIAGAGVASVSGTAPIVSSGGTTPAISISAATDSTAGSMSAADKSKLDSLPTPTITTGTATTGSPGVNLPSVPVPAGTTLVLDVTLVGEIILATPDIVIPVVMDFTYIFSAYGSSGAQIVGSATDSARTIAGPAGIAVTASVLGNNAILTVQPVLYQAFTSTHSYTGALKGSTTPPNAVGDGTNALITNGNLYVCTVGGTDSGSSGPTGTGAGPITAGGLTYYYVGPSNTAVTMNFTARVTPHAG